MRVPRLGSLVLGVSSSGDASAGRRLRWTCADLREVDRDALAAAAKRRGLRALLPADGSQAWLSWPNYTNNALASRHGHEAANDERLVRDLACLTRTVLEDLGLNL